MALTIAAVSASIDIAVGSGGALLNASGTAAGEDATEEAVDDNEDEDEVLCH